MDIGVMTDNLLKLKAFTLKGRIYTLTVLQVLDTSPASIDEQLKDLVTKAPRLFESAPVVLDLSMVKEADMDLVALNTCIRKHGLLPVAVQGGSELLHTRAAEQGLATLRASASHDKKVKENLVQAQHDAKPVATSATKLVTTPVRSGQQVVSTGDLIITASVSPGSELLAEGNIHVYGTLRGRALAGISGNENARIFCHAFDPELVAIAGVYRLPETIEPSTKPSQIFLKRDRIEIECL
jgi:septum site-determining protein MinC|tara:strand:+ start:45141 stop:45860 length:720 start_codon:yes stop_codon:yes gene_type:complete